MPPPSPRVYQSVTLTNRSTLQSERAYTTVTLTDSIGSLPSPRAYRTTHLTDPASPIMVWNADTMMWVPGKLVSWDGTVWRIGTSTTYGFKATNTPLGWA